MHEWSYFACDESATEALGQALARALEEVAPTSQAGTAGAGEDRAASVVALVGPLGAGKTRLVKAVAVALGVDRRMVSSPTFILVQEYRCRLPVYHFDAYRLTSADEFLDLGVEEYFSRRAICLVEWADRVAKCLPDERLVVTIEFAGPDARRFHFEALGPDYLRLLDRLAAMLPPGR
jgi:tRNA threonylcarbamoyladenosine biosynthesis protein TsaE